MRHFISLGAGVQSSTVALMAAHGELTPMPECAIFADTQSEPAAVYQWLGQLETLLRFPVHRVTAGSLREEILRGMDGRGATMNGRPPFFVAGGGMLRRQCTQDYKLSPIFKEVRRLLGLKPHQRWPKQIMWAQWIGISLDEAHRVKPATIRRKVKGVMRIEPHPTIQNRWPLIEREMTRQDCLQWLTEHGYPRPPKSSCTFCPYHDNGLWRDLKHHDPEAFADAVAIDRAIRPGWGWWNQNQSEWFVHRSLKPLEEIEFEPDERQGWLFGNECEGMCGV